MQVEAIYLILIFKDFWQEVANNNSSQETSTWTSFREEFLTMCLLAAVMLLIHIVQIQEVHQIQLSNPAT
jgi:hypothetical protein